MKPLFYRRSPHVICYWDEKGLVLENYVAHSRVGAHPVAALVLSALERWRTVDAICSDFPDYDPATVRASVRLLATHKFLERFSGKPPRDAPGRPWREWTPAAAHFHFTTKDARYTHDPQKERSFYRRRVKEWPIPAAVKRYAGTRLIALPAAQSHGEFPGVLLARRTWRRFSSRPVSLQDVATLLGLTWGVQSWMRFPILGRVARKTSPSGGARHPVEAYLIAQNVQGLARGVYHYAPDRHRLERVRGALRAAQIEELLTGQRWFRDAAALFVMTAVFPRTLWKYPSARAYRVVLADAGHLGQTFCLAATWLGLAPFCTMALADTKIERAVRIDGMNESVLYVVGVGARPADSRDPGDIPGMQL